MFTLCLCESLANCMYKLFTYCAYIDTFFSHHYLSVCIFCYTTLGQYSHSLSILSQYCIGISLSLFILQGQILQHLLSQMVLNSVHGPTYMQYSSPWPEISWESRLAIYTCTHMCIHVLHIIKCTTPLHNHDYLPLAPYSLLIL